MLGAWIHGGFILSTFNRFALVILATTPITAWAGAVNVDMGTAALFSVLGGSTISNTGPTVVDGNVGVWPGSAVTGFPPGILAGGTMYPGDAVAQQAQSDLTSAYNFAAGQTCAGGNDRTGIDLGAASLFPDVYCFASNAQLTGTLTLDAQSDPNSVFIFQIGTTLTTATNSSVVFANGGHGRVFWQVGSSATLGTNTTFIGSVLATTSISLNAGATIGEGRALARNGSVTLDSNTISSATLVPEPSALSLLLLVALPGLWWIRQERAVKYQE